jgi:hypothetical protein
MSIEDVKQLKTVNGVTQAQGLLDKGWVILAVCVCQDGNSQYAEYHMGNTTEAKPASQLPEGGGFQREVAPPPRF